MFIKITSWIPDVGNRKVDLDVTKIGYIAKRQDSNYDIYFGFTKQANLESISQEDYDKIIALRNGLERQYRMDSVL
jgi:hypothetical protein